MPSSEPKEKVMDETVERCPVCGAVDVVRLVPEWQAAVEAGARIPVIGCGNPWHYAGMES